ncbi:hypothetical protein D3OALGA1CA_2637, partial [Olavius algarvensis associated proteobacterium Delta 3]
GTGEILFSQSGNRRSGGQTNYVQPVDGGTLTIGPGIRIYGQEGVVGTASLPLVNQGTIDSDSGQTIFVRGSSVTNAGGALLASDGTLNVDNLTGNAGHASVSAGSHLDLDGTYTVDQDLPVPQATLTLRGDWTNPSVIDAADGTVTLQGTWSNAGTINAANTALTLQGAWNNPGTIAATDATVNLHGTFTQSDLGVFNRTGSNTVNINGTLENAGETLLLDAATTWRLNGGRINGGTVTGEVGNPLVISAGSTLDGVVLDADVAMTAAGSSYYYTLTLTVVNGLTLNGRLTMTRSGYWDAGALNFSGDQTLGGTGEIL